MLQLKVCGMRDTQNIEDLVKIEPQFMGFIFHEKSPRNLLAESLKIPSHIHKVGVFVNETEGFILDRIEKFDLKYLQLHGNESPLFCKRVRLLKRKVIKVFNIHPDFDFSTLKKYESCCDYFLFDTFGEKAGGNGFPFNWELLNNYKGSVPFFLSGGIDSKMVDKIKSINHPKLAGVDINSRFEETIAIKDIKKIKQFKNELQH